MTLDEKLKVAAIVLEYISALAWPTVVVVLVCIFREQARDLIKRLKGADLPGGVKLNLQETIQQAERLSEEVREIKPPPDKKDIPVIPVTEANGHMLSLGLRPSPSGLDLEYYRTLAQQDPNIALAGLRIELEILTRNIATGFRVEIPDRASLRQVVATLHKEGALTSEQRQLIDKISHVCNAAVHGELVTIHDAELVIDTAGVLATQYVSWLSWGFDP